MWQKLSFLTLLLVCLVSCGSMPVSDTKSGWIPADSKLKIRSGVKRNKLKIASPATNYHTAILLGPVVYAADELIASIKTAMKQRLLKENIHLHEIQTKVLGDVFELSLEGKVESLDSNFNKIISKTPGFHLKYHATYNISSALEVLNVYVNYSLWHSENNRAKRIYGNSLHYQSKPQNPAFVYLTDDEEKQMFADMYRKYPMDIKSVARRKIHLEKLLDAKKDYKRILGKNPQYKRDGSPWFENESKKLKNIVELAAKEVALIVMKDIYGEVAAYTVVKPHSKLQWKYRALEFDNGRVVIRDRKNKLVSRHKDFPIIPNHDLPLNH